MLDNVRRDPAHARPLRAGEDKHAAELLTFACRCSTPLPGPGAALFAFIRRYLCLFWLHPSPAPGPSGFPLFLPRPRCYTSAMRTRPPNHPTNQLISQSAPPRRRSPVFLPGKARTEATIRLAT